MDEQQPAEGSLGPASAATGQPAAASAPDHSDRRGEVVVGGLLAGLGLGVALALLMHVVQEASPIGINIDGSVALELIVAGPLFGLGLAMAVAALVPSARESSPPASAGPANPADHPPDV